MSNQKAKVAINPQSKPATDYSRAGFCFADGLTLEEMDLSAFRWAGLALPEGERNRLVKASKSQTREKTGGPLVVQAQRMAFSTRIRQRMGPAPLPCIADGAFSELGANVRRERQAMATDEAAIARSVDGAGTSTVIEYREWCEQYRIRTRVNGQMAIAPPSNSGARESVMLTEGGARKIAESCEYLATQFDGYSTFATGTFDDEARARIASGETSVQKEATRTLDAMKKMYLRGWEYIDDSGNKKIVDPAGLAFKYCWVVEIPKNQNGEDNPHIHLLMAWKVDFADFPAWSKRIESLWSNGYFKLEKIKDKDAAGAYMAKAAGYITKANGQSDQGLVKGNRYAISKPARAPAWVTLSVKELGIMGRLIRETYDHIQHKYQADFEKRRQLNSQRDRMVKIASRSGDKDKLKKSKAKIGALLVKVRTKINAIPIRASKYHLVIKGEEAFNKFISRAQAVGWGSDAPPSTKWIFVQKRLRQAWQETDLCQFLERKQGFVEEALSAFGDYEQWAAVEAAP